MPDVPVFSTSPIKAARLVGQGERRSPGCVDPQGSKAAGGEHRSPCSGLPILSTEPLTASERDALRVARAALRVAADQLDEAIERNRVKLALEAVARWDAAAVHFHRAHALLGRNR